MKKKILVLVHPDCIAEQNENDAVKYSNLLKQYKGNFDYIITHKFFSDFIFDAWKDSDKLPRIKMLWKTIDEISDVVLYDNKNMYSCSYAKELPDYLIDNPETDIFMAGGYESNCLWISYKQLFQKLHWLIKEQNIKVFFYKPLIFHYNHLNAFERQYPHSDKDKPIDDFDKTYGNFHPDKINYKENSFKNYVNKMMLRS